MQLTRLGREQRPHDATVLAVSVDSREDSRFLIGELDETPEHFPLHLLEDREHRVIDRYGLRNASSRKGIPHPATFVIDREGIVRWRFVETDYSVRAPNEEILEALRQLGS